jgi:hypothetical protein
LSTGNKVGNDKTDATANGNTLSDRQIVRASDFVVCRNSEWRMVVKRREEEKKRQ